MRAPTVVPGVRVLDGSPRCSVPRGCPARGSVWHSRRSWLRSRSSARSSHRTRRRRSSCHRSHRRLHVRCLAETRRDGTCCPGSCTGGRSVIGLSLLGGGPGRRTRSCGRIDGRVQARGAVDDILMRSCDVLLAFPTIIFALLLVAGLGPHLWLLVVAVALGHAPQTARVIRGASRRGDRARVREGGRADRDPETAHHLR